MTGAKYAGGNYAHNGPLHRIMVITQITVGLLLLYSYLISGLLDDAP